MARDLQEILIQILEIVSGNDQDLQNSLESVLKSYEVVDGYDGITPEIELILGKRAHRAIRAALPPFDELNEWQVEVVRIWMNDPEFSG